jgi:hypothetical protein
MNNMQPGPTGFFDYIVAAVAVGVLLMILYLCIRYFLRPGETNDDHIKKKILDDEVRHDRKAGQ